MSQNDLLPYNEKVMSRQNGEITFKPRTVTLAIILIVLLAFTLRFIFFYQIATSPIAEMVIEDCRTYNDWARRIAGGDWLGNEVFFALPLYPYFLGSIYAVFGYHLQLARFIQVLLGTLNCYLLFLLGRRLFSPLVGILAAFFMAVYGWLIVYDAAILSPVLIIFLGTASLLFLHRTAEPGRLVWGWLGCGVLIGLTGVASAHALLFVLFVLGWIVFAGPAPHRRRLVSALLFLVGVVAVNGSVAYRNWHVGKDFVPLTAHGGINFFIGNNPYARGVFEPPPVLRSGGATLQLDSVKLAERALGRRLKPSEVSGYWFGQGFKFVKLHPGNYFRLLWRKFTIFWDNLEIGDVIHPYFFREIAPIINLPFLTFGMIAPFSILGLILAGKRWRKLSLLYLFVFSHIISTILYFVNSRYRLAIAPFLMLFAAYTVSWWWEKLRRKEIPWVVVSLIPLILFVLWVNPQLIGEPRFILNLGAGYNHLGTFYSQQGDLDGALREFEKALELEPYRAEAHFNLANIRLKRGETEAALRGYREAIRINPFYDSAHFAIAQLYEKEGKIDSARKKYLDIISNLPENSRAYLGLARLFLKEEKEEEATNILARAASRKIPDGAIYFYLSLAYRKKGDLAGARRVIEEGLSILPADGNLHLELGRLLTAQPGEGEKALSHLQKARRLLPRNPLTALSLGDLYYRQGRMEEARREWAAAEAIQPGGAGRERLEALNRQMPISK